MIDILPASSFERIIINIRKTGNPLCCILLAPMFDEIGQKEFVPRIGYINQRTSGRIHFYCAGYGYGWSKSTAPDLVNIGFTKIKEEEEISWAFSQTKFAEFVDEMEAATSWIYSGGTELIVLNSRADFTNAIIFRMDTMLSDGVILKASELFEAIIQQGRKKNNSIQNFSLREIGKNSAEAIVDSIVELLPKSVKPLKNIWTKGRHYVLDDISKKK